MSCPVEVPNKTGPQRGINSTILQWVPTTSLEVFFADPHITTIRKFFRPPVPKYLQVDSLRLTAWCWRRWCSANDPCPTPGIRTLGRVRNHSQPVSPKAETEMVLIYQPKIGNLSPNWFYDSMIRWLSHPALLDLLATLPHSGIDSIYNSEGKSMGMSKHLNI